MNRPLRYGTICSGIGAVECAWTRLGWVCAWCCEIAEFPSRVLAHHYPGVPNHHDLEVLARGEVELEPVDVLIGGTPCQSFSVAGLRGGLADPRGNLALAFLQVVGRVRPRWVVWENVPGVLSSVSHDAPDPRPPARDLDGDDRPDDGEEVVVEDEYDADEDHALACFLAGLSELGYGWAYRVLDAQYFGVAQRRRRVFVVGCAGGDSAAAAVLLERASLRGDPPPSRAPRENSAPRAASSSRIGLQGVANPIGATKGGWADDFERSGAFIPEVAHSLRGEGFDASEDGTGRGTPLVPTVIGALTAHGGIGSTEVDAGQYLPVAVDMQNGLIGPVAATLMSAQARWNNGGGALVFDETQVTHPENRSNPQPGDPAPTLGKQTRPPTIAFSAKDHGADATEDLSPTLRAGGFTTSHANGGVGPAVAFHMTQDPISGAVSPALGTTSAGMGAMTSEAGRMVVRRLTPRECERLQGFPDDYTAIPGGSDSSRYMALGNSMAVPVIEWLGRRIELVESALSEAA